MINTILSMVIPVAQIYLLFRIWRELRVISLDSERKAELNESIKKFGAMFAEAAEKKIKKKVVEFDGTDEA
jgi:hypothetical protein